MCYIIMGALLMFLGCMVWLNWYEQQTREMCEGAFVQYGFDCTHNRIEPRAISIIPWGILPSVSFALRMSPMELIRKGMWYRTPNNAIQESISQEKS